MDAMDIKYGLIDANLCSTLGESKKMFRLTFKAILLLLKFGKNNRRGGVRIEGFGTFHASANGLEWRKRFSRGNSGDPFNEEDITFEMEKLVFVKDNIKQQINIEIVNFIFRNIANIYYNVDSVFISGFGNFYVKEIKEKIISKGQKTKIIKGSKRIVFHADPNVTIFLNNARSDGSIDQTPIDQTPIEPFSEMLQSAKIKLSTQDNQRFTTIVEFYPKHLIDANDPLNETSFLNPRFRHFLYEINTIKKIVFQFETPVTHKFALARIIKPERFPLLATKLESL